MSIDHIEYSVDEFKGGKMAAVWFNQKGCHYLIVCWYPTSQQFSECFYVKLLFGGKIKYKSNTDFIID